MTKGGANDRGGLAATDAGHAPGLALIRLARIRGSGLVRPNHESNGDRPLSRQTGAVDRPVDSHGGRTTTGCLSETALPIAALGWPVGGDSAPALVVAGSP